MPVFGAPVYGRALRAIGGVLHTGHPRADTGPRQPPASVAGRTAYSTSQALELLAPPNRRSHRPQMEMEMLHYAVVFLVIALIAAVFGFGGIAAGAVGIAKILFFVFVIMAIVTFVLGLLNKR